MPLERFAQGLAGLGVHRRRVLSPLPETRRLPSRAEGDAENIAFMALERLPDRLAGLGVPQAQGLVHTAGDDAGAIRLKATLETQFSWP